jgi:hypothetical protein
MFNKFWMAGIGCVPDVRVPIWTRSFTAQLQPTAFSKQMRIYCALWSSIRIIGRLGNHGNMWSTQELASDELVITTKVVTGMMVVYCFNCTLTSLQSTIRSSTDTGNSATEE